ncbi:MAG: hypothetical protein CHACPFDD_00107 [Phycisphaerae bacterium]|nr:hypothetical protein [Phycisphaerae bacterium]
MCEGQSGPVTRMLEAAAGGDRRAAADLLPLVYDELRRLARARMARFPGQTTRPTSLVHEAYLKLVGKDEGWAGKAHFFAAAAQAMRQILVDQARRKSAQKRGGGARLVRARAVSGGGRESEIESNEPELAIEPPSKNMVTLDDALRRLEERDARKAQVVTMRFFGGMTIDETASALGISTATVEREWRFARAVLLEELAELDDDALG